MDKFTIEKVFIGEKVIDEITDEYGVKWYPLKRFLESILCKYDKISKFRDSVIIRYMQVIEYAADKRAPERLIKTWCINENGIKYLLRRMSIFQKGKENINLYRAREKGFFEACLYFKVKAPDKLNPLYINFPPKIDQYDVWSILCIENDLKLKNNDRWKRCEECNYYYPDRVRYFGSNKKNNKKCLQCQGKNFECQNKVIQFIYDNGGYDLLYKLHSNNPSDDIVNELIKFIGLGGKKTNEN